MAERTGVTYLVVLHPFLSLSNTRVSSLLSRLSFFGKGFPPADGFDGPIWHEIARLS